MDVVVSFVLGFFLSFLIGAILMGDECLIGTKAEPLIVECEKELPRNEYCTIIAVPKNSLEMTDE